MKREMTKDELKNLASLMQGGAAKKRVPPGAPPPEDGAPVPWVPRLNLPPRDKPKPFWR